MKRYRYVVYRHGSSAANRSTTPVTPVGIETAPDQAAARSQMARRVSLYNNQFLSAVPASRCSKADRIAAQEREEAYAENDGGYLS